MSLKDNKHVKAFIKTYKKSPATVILATLVIFLSVFTIYLFQRLTAIEKATGLGGQVQEPQAPTELNIKKPSTNEHWRGSKNVRYVWVEYSDFECPFCKKMHPDILKLLDEYKGKISWVYRHYPLSFHQNAQKEAEASECAAEQGSNDAFWKYTDLIFERTTSNGTGFALDALAPLAAEIGLDQEKFEKCLDDDKYAKKVKEQFDEGSTAGVRATPTGVIYDLKTGKTRVVEGAVPYDEMKKALNDFLAKNK